LPRDLSNVTAPIEARLVGYDAVTGAQFLAVPGTPMVAIVQGDVVVTFPATEAAEFKMKLKGYGADDFKKGI